MDKLHGIKPGDWVRVVSVTEGFIGKPMDEGYVGIRSNLLGIGGSMMFPINDPNVSFDVVPRPFRVDDRFQVKMPFGMGRVGTILAVYAEKAWVKWDCNPFRSDETEEVNLSEIRHIREG